MFYNFVKNMFDMGQIDAIKVMSYVPTFITHEEGMEIVGE